MVIKYSELQGIHGEIYATYVEENKMVAKTVREHYMPLNTKGKLPSEVPGAIVSIADKIDTIVGCISVGLIPSGSQDPYGLRRQAVGLLRILTKENWNISVEELLSYALKLYTITDVEIDSKLKEFMKNRADRKSVV